MRWKDTVLLIEKSKSYNLAQINKSKWFWVFPNLFIALFFLTLLQFKITIESKFFFMFPILGVLFSIAAIKDLFGTKSELLNSFCNLTASTSCTSVVDSKKWKIFEIFNFSDLSIIFFSFQFLGLLFFLFINPSSVIAYFSIQKIALICSIPILLTSIYYQKIVEKKWCPICLVIIAIVILELLYILFLVQSPVVIHLHNLIISGFIFVTVAFGWITLKKLLILQKELKEFQLKGLRFMRNYEIFKNNLLASNSIENSTMESEESIILGNPQASLKIMMVTSPFCGFCKEAHYTIKEIVAKNYGKVCFDIRFNFSEVNSDQKTKKIYQQLMSIYFNQGQEKFMSILHDWFENRDESKLKKTTEKSSIDELKLNLILEKQYKWNQIAGINYTPTVFINGYLWPKQYEINNLIYFVDDLSEDEDFQFTLNNLLNQNY